MSVRTNSLLFGVYCRGISLCERLLLLVRDSAARGQTANETASETASVMTGSHAGRDPAITDHR